MTQNPGPKLPTGQTVVWNEEKLITQYANIMALSMSSFDISVTFGEIGLASPTEVHGVAKVKIILSPEQAFNLLQVLTIATQKYVEANGALRTSGALNAEEFSKAMGEHTYVRSK